MTGGLEKRDVRELKNFATLDAAVQVWGGRRLDKEKWGERTEQVRS